MTDFKGKTAVITGAANGFGKEFAKECATREMKMVLADIEADALDATVAEISGMGADVTGMVADVSIYEEMEKVLNTAVEKYGSLDLLFNNAGIYFIGNIWDVPPQDLQWMFEINVLSVLYGMKLAIPIMQKQGTPCHIVNTASGAGLMTTRSMSAYHATKHAVVAASEASLYDLQGAGIDNIGISVFCPGYVQTTLHHTPDRRPERFKKDDPYYQTEAYKKNTALVDKFITTGEAIDVVAPDVFKGIENDKFYIRTKFTDKVFTPIIIKRAYNILNKQNPDIKTHMS